MDLDAIKERLAKATSGPWELQRRDVGAPLLLIYAANGYGVGEAWNISGHPQNLANAALIAHAPSDISALVAEVEALSGLLQKWLAWHEGPGPTDSPLAAETRRALSHTPVSEKE